MKSKKLSNYSTQMTIAEGDIPDLLSPIIPKRTRMEMTLFLSEFVQHGWSKALENLEMNAIQISAWELVDAEFCEAMTVTKKIYRMAAANNLEFAQVLPIALKDLSEEFPETLDRISAIAKIRSVMEDENKEDGSGPQGNFTNISIVMPESVSESDLESYKPKLIGEVFDYEHKIKG